MEYQCNIKLNTYVQCIINNIKSIIIIIRTRHNAYVLIIIYNKLFYNCLYLLQFYLHISYISKYYWLFRIE